MDWAIPLQNFNLENVHLGPLIQGPKPITQLSYKDADFTFPSLILLMPMLPIKSYDPVSGRLVLSLADSPQALQKLLGLQDMLLSSVNTNYGRWFPKSMARKIADLRSTFQPMLFEQEMHLYCPNSNSNIQGPNIYSKGAWSKNSALSALSTMPIRVVLRIQGISFHLHPSTGQWSGKFRLQHKILSIIS